MNARFSFNLDFIGIAASRRGEVDLIYDRKLVSNKVPVADLLATRVPAQLRSSAGLDFARNNTEAFSVEGRNMPLCYFGSVSGSAQVSRKQYGTQCDRRGLSRGTTT